MPEPKTVLLTFTTDEPTAERVRTWAGRDLPDNLADLSSAMDFGLDLISDLADSPFQVTTYDPNALESVLSNIDRTLPERVMTWADNLDKDKKLSKKEAEELIWTVATALLTERAMAGTLERT